MGLGQGKATHAPIRPLTERRKGPWNGEGFPRGLPRLALFLLMPQAQKKKLCKKKTPFLWGVAPNPIRFLKKTKQKTFKLGRSGIKFEASYPDGVEPIKVERTIFEK